ncbi:hypothetical protein E2C01_097741 [Portunus trituberculatus]|uniref:Uncharacterized protein n=1 Tax=Portunus trituberculatus TaxID=210409 RepID=A0A5B7K579_PORTR|nr:hypothetical protein [Portunus trituberculatus]
MTDPSNALAGLMCLMHAHLSNAFNPGYFQETLSTSLAENGLPDIKLPTPPPPRVPNNILQAVSEGIGRVFTTTQGASSPEEMASSGSASTAEAFVAPSPSSSSNTGVTDDSDSEPEEDLSSPKETEEVGFGFLSKYPKRRKPPSTIAELDQVLRNKTLILSHTGPPHADQIILDHVKDNLASLQDWILPKGEDYERFKKDPNQILRDALPGRIILARE